METQDKTKFKELMSGLGQMFGRLSVSEEMLELYFQSLESFTFEQISEAALKYITTGKYLPRPAELIEIMVGTSSERARIAFLSAVRVRESVKACKSVAFEDKTTHEVIYALGGWSEFCHQLSTNRSALEARFIKWHEAAQTGELKAPKVLIGTMHEKNYLEVCKNDVIRSMQAQLLEQL